MAWPGWYPYPGIWFDGPYLRSDSALELAGSAVLDGAGVIGDSIGMTTTQSTTTAGTTRAAERFITETISTGEEASAGVETNVQRGASGNRGVAKPPARPFEGDRRQLEDTPSPAARAAFAREPSAATATAERPGAIPRAEAPASVAEAFTAVAEGMAAVAGGVIVGSLCSL